MRKVAGHASFLLSFVPKQWNAVKKFSTFKYEPMEKNFLFNRGIKATSDHLEKFIVLAEIANELIPGFDKDRSQLDENGYSPAKYSRQFAAIAECSINELYAALDGIRDVIYAVYSNIQGVQKKSTSKLFSKAKNCEYGDSFPEQLRTLLSEAYDEWFLLLRKYRTEFTHGSLGSCSKDHDTGKISYMHAGLGSQSRALVIEDFIDYINRCIQSLS